PRAPRALSRCPPRRSSDLEGEERGPRELTGAACSLVSPSPVRAPRLLHASAELATSLGHDAAALGRAPLLDALSGNGLLPGMKRSEEHTSELQSREKIVCR